MPLESSPLRNDQTTFRGAERSSNLRANIFLLESVVILILYIYLIYGWRLHYSTQAHLIAAFGAIYIVRLNVMSRWILQRELALEEVTFVILIWVPSIMGSYVIAAKDGISSVALLAASILYLLGSYLNTYSELQRKIWKRHPSNKGRCYMIGLFSWSRNINYFGDSLLFTGWAIATGNWVNSWAPIVMSLTFYFYHIPEKETYLTTRYAKDWPTYVKHTPYAFIPFIC